MLQANPVSRAFAVVDNDVGNRLARVDSLAQLVDPIKRGDRASVMRVLVGTFGYSLVDGKLRRVNVTVVEVTEFPLKTIADRFWSSMLGECLDEVLLDILDELGGAPLSTLDTPELVVVLI